MYVLVLTSNSKLILNSVPSTRTDRISFRSPVSFKNCLVVAGSIENMFMLPKGFRVIFSVSVFVSKVIFSFILFSMFVSPTLNEDFKISISLFLEEV